MTYLRFIYFSEKEILK